MNEKSEIDLSLWRQLFMREPEGIFVIVDPQVGENRGQLRSWSLLYELGLRRVTFTTSWHSIPFVPYEHFVIHEGMTADNLVDVFPLVQFISQDTEDRSPSDVTKKLLTRQKNLHHSLLVFVIESESFVLRDSTGSKSFIDEYELQKVYGYEALFSRYCEIRNLPTRQLGVDQSLNLRLHYLAWDQREASFRRLADLFDYTSIPHENWAWDLLQILAANDKVREDDRGLANMLGPWIDSDITWVVNRILEAIQQFNYDPELIRLHRETKKLELREER